MENLERLFGEDIPFPFCEKDYNGEVDNRDTYNLDVTFFCWIYERLCVYYKQAKEIVDLNYHTFVINGEKITLEECLQRMIKELDYILLHSDYTEEVIQAKNRFFEIFKETIFSLWW